MSALTLTLFALLWAAIVYLLNCALARKYKKIDIKVAALYVTSIGMLGTSGEILVGNIYLFLFHKMLWEYRVLPVHHGYTSHYAPVIWGILGFHIYLLHDTLRKRSQRTLNYLALLFAGETILVEIAGNFSFKLLFHQYIFYYFPSDLWHLTSVQTLPFYVAAGFVVVKMIQGLKVDPVFFTSMALGLAVVLVFLT